MGRQPVHLTRERVVFEKALNRTRCPKCRGKVLETSMPDVVCEKCGTQYTLATRMDQGLFGGGLHYQLVEKITPQPVAAPVAQAPMQQTAASGRFCFNCGSAVQEAARFCPSCGTRLS